MQSKLSQRLSKVVLGGLALYFIYLFAQAIVPKHIFVIVAINELHLNHFAKGIYINNKKYYILESTAKNSSIGFPLRYKLSEIHAIIEPFENRKLDIGDLEWKL